MNWKSDLVRRPNHFTPLSIIVPRAMHVWPGCKSAIGAMLRRDEDRRNMAPIADLQPGQTCMARGTIIESGVKWFGRRTKSLFQFILDDGSGRLYCRWF